MQMFKGVNLLKINSINLPHDPVRFREGHDDFLVMPDIFERQLPAFPALGVRDPWKVD